MKKLLIVSAIAFTLASCRNEPYTDTECRQHIDYSNQFAGEMACRIASMGPFFGVHWW